MSKVDPTTLGKLDRKSTILLQASRQHTEQNEKSEIAGMEDPGMDALRGGFGTIGSIIRARSMSRMSMSTTGSFRQRRRLDEESRGGLTTHGLENLPRHQLYDAPMPDSEHPDDISMQSQPSIPNITLSPHPTTIRFEDGDIAHYYPSPGKSGTPVHESRQRTTSTGRVPQTVREADEEDEDSDAFDPRQIPRSPQGSPRRKPRPQKSDSDPFRERNPISTELPLFSSESPTPRDSEDDLVRVSSPEDTRGRHPLMSSRHRRQSSSRSYPGGNSSSDDEQEARSSLVQGNDGPSTPRGGIRLVSSKNTTPRRI